MATKHEPQVWDMYRTPHGAYITIQAVNDHAVAYANTVPSMRTMERKLLDECVFVGNALALPKLVEACLLAEDCLNPETDPRSSGMTLHKLREALREAGLGVEVRRQADEQEKWQ